MSKNNFFVAVAVLCFCLCCVCTAFGDEGKGNATAYDAGGRRNPFAPLITPDGRLLQLETEETAGEPRALALEGIIYDKSGLSYAIVNGAVVKIGDSIGEYQVLRIEKHRVVFVKDGQPQTIELKEEGE